MNCRRRAGLCNTDINIVIAPMYFLDRHDASSLPSQLQIKSAAGKFLTFIVCMSSDIIRNIQRDRGRCLFGGPVSDWLLRMS